MAMEDTGPSLDGAAERVPDPAGGFPLAYNQRALWFIERLAPGNAAYHIAGTGRLLGPVDTAALHRAMAALVDRHPALRTTFHDFDDGPLQRVCPQPEPTFDFRDEGENAGMPPTATSRRSPRSYARRRAGHSIWHTARCCGSRSSGRPPASASCSSPSITWWAISSPSE